MALCFRTYLVIKFSIILNSRGRSALLFDLLQNIQEKTSNLDEIEILVSCDEDDTETVKIEGFLLSQFRFLKMEFIPRDRHLLKRLNVLSKRAVGQYIFVLNDDCLLLNKNWDIESYRTLEEYLEDKPDGIVYGLTQDNSCDKGGDYASFFVISKKAINALGFFVHEKFMGLGGDAAIHRVYKEIDRVVKLPIYIDHYLHSTLQMVNRPDLTGLEMRQLSLNANECFSFDITEDVQRLQRSIRKDEVQ